MNLPRHAHTFVALGLLGGLALGASTGIAFGRGAPGTAGLGAATLGQHRVHGQTIDGAPEPFADLAPLLDASSSLGQSTASTAEVAESVAAVATSSAPGTETSEVPGVAAAPPSANSTDQEIAAAVQEQETDSGAVPAPATPSPNDAPPGQQPPGPQPDPRPASAPSQPPADILGPHISNTEDPPPVVRNRILASRRPTSDDKVILGFREVPVSDTIKFIVESTGKVVMTRLTQIQPTKITLLNDQPISRHEALDLLFKAFRLNNIGVVETEREIIIDILTDIPKIQDPGVVLGPNDSVLDRTDDGLIVTKIFSVKQARADVLVDQIKEFLPDYALLTVDANSNQLILQGNVGVAKRVQMLLNSIDRPPYIPVETRTFRLAYADASTIATVIQDLFESTRSATARPGGAQAGLAGRQQQPAGRQPARPAGAGGAPEQIGTSEHLRVTTLPQINAVVVSAEPDILKQIERYIIGYWDIPLSKTEGDLFRVYTLEYADPIIVRDVLQTMLEGGSSGGSRGAAGRGGVGGAGRANVGGGGGGAGGGGDADAAVANIFRIDAIPDNRQIIVVSRTPENFGWLSQVIQQIDQPTKAGLPLLVQLKHANAVEVAEQLNALLAPPGAQASIRDQQTGLNLGQQFAQQLGGPASAAGGGGAAAGGGAAGGGGAGAQTGQITFPWQSTQGAGGQDRALESAIIGKVRIVPIIRQNALSILATPEMQQAVLDIVTALDRPGRQVLIAAVFASVELKDEFAYGLRVSPNGVVSPLQDNSFGGSVSNENTEENFISAFTTSVLNLNFDAQILVQALDQKTNAKILQSPKLFVSDNTEGVFFVGQDVPIITSTQINDLGNTNNSFEYQQVGLLLNVRPRITQQRDVSMEINLTLSNIVPGLIVNGGQVFDRRTTQTQITVKNGQTIVLSGIRVENQSDIKRRVPILGYAPIIGDLLFTSTDTANNVQELLAFITPLVVDNPEENNENFNEDARRRLDDLRRPMDELIKQGIGNETFDPENWVGREPSVEPRPPSDPTILLPGGTSPPSSPGNGSNGGPAAPAGEATPASGGRIRGMGG